MLYGTKAVATYWTLNENSNPELGPGLPVARAVTATPVLPAVGYRTQRRLAYQAAPARARAPATAPAASQASTAAPPASAPLPGVPGKIPIPPISVGGTRVGVTVGVAVGVSVSVGVGTGSWKT